MSINEFEDLILDDLSVEKKKKVNGKKKGNRVELQLAKLLSKRFGKPFSRSVGSGNRWSQVSNMPDHAKETLIGDLCCFSGFKYVVECKAGYGDAIDLNSIHDGISQIDKFIKQSEHDAELSGKLPIIIWKRNNKPWLAMIKKENAVGVFLDIFIMYNNWIIVSLNELLKQPDEFWIKE